MWPWYGVHMHCVHGTSCLTMCTLSASAFVQPSLHQLFLWRSNYKLAYLLPQLNVSIVSYWSIIVFLFILFLYAVSYTEFESYSSSSTLNSTCDIPVLLNDRKCWARGREGEGGSKCAMTSKMFIFIVILLSFGFPHFTEGDARM